MKINPKRISFFLFKFILIAIITVIVLNYLSLRILGAPLINKKITSFITYPFEKSSCENRGGSYYYNPSLSGYWCAIPGELQPMKPVIYLYPERKTEVNVKIKYNPGFSVTYPSYQNGWNVTAEPDGRVINNYDGKEYSYLFWEGNSDPGVQYDMSTGFVVKGSETAEFLQNKLSEVGLTPKEYNEFIVYWYPKMKQNPYNLIHFASSSEYDDRVVLEVSPKPDSVLRVFMVYRSLEKPVTIQPQNLNPFIRKGFTVAEWGGTELN